MSLKKYFIVVIIIFYLFPDEVSTTDFVLVTGTQIKFISNEIANTTTNVKLSDNIRAVAYDPKRKDFYVSTSNGINGSVLYRIKISGTTMSNVTRIVVHNSWTVVGIAFDHKTSTLYWTTYEGISYVKVPKKEIKVPLIGKPFLGIKGRVPSSIAIDVNRRYLYWGNSGSVTRNATIERSRLNGFRWKELAQDLNDPWGITVDEEINMLYWIDRPNGDSHSLYSMNLDNGTTQTLVHAADEWSPYVITLDHENMFWIDWEMKEMWMRAKNRLDVSPTQVSKIELNDQPIGLFVLSGSETMHAGEKNGKNEVNKSKGRAGSRILGFLNN